MSIQQKLANRTNMLLGKPNEKRKDTYMSSELRDGKNIKEIMELPVDDKLSASDMYAKYKALKMPNPQQLKFEPIVVDAHDPVVPAQPILSDKLRQQNLYKQTYKNKEFPDCEITNSSDYKQTRLDMFFKINKDKEKPKPPSFIQKQPDGTIKFAVRSQPPEPKKVENKAINLNQCSEVERRKIFESFAKQDQQKTQKEKDKDKLQKLHHQLNNPNVIKKGIKDVYELMKEDGGMQSSIQIKKRDGQESKRMSTFKKMFEGGSGQVEYTGKPVFEFNRLLKYLFLKDYSQADNQDEECKVIPDSFSSGEEYCKIFEYLFLNESTSQIKSDLIDFMRKTKYRYRRVQIKVDEQQLDKDGTILQMRSPIQNFEESDNDKKESSDDEQPAVKDNNCDLTQLKNYLIVFSSRFRMELSDINKFTNPHRMLFFGMLIDPCKSQYLAQIRIQTFIDRSLMPNDWVDIILFPINKLTTLIREYQMINYLQYTPLADAIFNPSETQDQGYIARDNILFNSQVLKPFFDQIQPKYNQSQFRSIEEIVLKDHGICLLQGPPGTGKTHTLLGLLSGIYEYMTLQNRFPRRKILICAPSNAAVDEIILRIINGGIQDSTGNSRQVKLVRMGVLDEENENCELIKTVSLEEMTQQQLFKKQAFQVQADQRTTSDLRIELNQKQQQINKLEKQKKQIGVMADQRRSIEAKIEQIFERKRQISKYLDEMRQQKKKFKESYTDLAEKILNQAEIICSTLSSSGSEKLTKYIDQFDLLIVDEAAQCTEPSNIIPLRLGIQKLVLIGDPKQLPATTFSMISNQTLYNRSLFERILDNKTKPYFLDTQYRMHSEIRMFPSLYFYDNKLLDHESTKNRVQELKYFSKRMTFIDCVDSQESRDNTSYINKAECQIVIRLIHLVRSQFESISLGVICAYKAQVKYIKNEFKRQYPDLANTSLIAINTVDSFQGQEKDLVIFSCVRSSQSGGIGFLNDARRMNVALTRAKDTLIVIGHAATLCKSTLWKSFLRNMNIRNLYRKTTQDNQLLEEKVLTDQWLDNEMTMNKDLLNLINREDKKHYQKATYNIKDFSVQGQAQYTDAPQEQKQLKQSEQQQQLETTPCIQQSKQKSIVTNEQVVYKQKSDATPIKTTKPQQNTDFDDYLSLEDMIKLSGILN